MCSDTVSDKNLGCLSLNTPDRLVSGQGQNAPMKLNDKYKSSCLSIERKIAIDLDLHSFYFEREVTVVTTTGFISVC